MMWERIFFVVLIEVFCVGLAWAVSEYDRL